ncbi:MAG: hypothetical protein OK454_02845, partial [Thaumarchaeota archaeon]|nr:hypothetical protein [Nitrososphaerota archaeon]
RLVGLHKLTIVSLYSWFMKSLTPRQQSVTSFLASLAQGTHNLVPPDALEPLVLKIANEFVSEASAPEVASAGLNAIREICVRQPLAMNETLLQDLVQYRKSKDKGVSMSAKGLLSLYREVGADMLKRRDRGKEAAMGLRSGELKQPRFGEEEAGGIEGLELLEKWKEEDKKRKRAAKGLPEKADGEEDDEDEDEDDFNSSDWEVASSDSSDSGGWIDVEHSDDEAPPLKKVKKVDGDSDGDSDSDGDDDHDHDDDDDDDESASGEDEDKENEIQRISKLATSSILTPADLAKLRELRMEANIDKAMGNIHRRQKEAQERHADEPLTADQIELPAKLRKSTKEERVALAREGKPGREEHKSTQAIRKSKMMADGKSTTNKEKARRKNLFMTMRKAKAKNKRSLVETRKILKSHIERTKRGGRRGNNG